MGSTVVVGGWGQGLRQGYMAHSTRSTYDMPIDVDLSEIWMCSRCRQCLRQAHFGYVSSLNSLIRLGLSLVSRKGCMRCSKQIWNAWTPLKHQFIQFMNVLSQKLWYSCHCILLFVLQCCTARSAFRLIEHTHTHTIRKQLNLSSIWLVWSFLMPFTESFKALPICRRWYWGIAMARCSTSTWENGGWWSGLWAYDGLCFLHEKICAQQELCGGQLQWIWVFNASKVFASMCKSCVYTSCK